MSKRIVVIVMEGDASVDDVVQTLIEAGGVEATALPPAPGRWAWPVPTYAGQVTQPFGINPQHYEPWGLPAHEGIDMRAPLGTPIVAVAAGVVSRVDRYGGDPRKQPYGHSVRVLHADGLHTSIYAHFQNPPVVKVGEHVARGQVLGHAGSTGNSSGPHLHFAVKRRNATADGIKSRIRNRAGEWVEVVFPHDLIDPTPFLESS